MAGSSEYRLSPLGKRGHRGWRIPHGKTYRALGLVLLLLVVVLEIGCRRAGPPPANSGSSGSGTTTLEQPADTVSAAPADSTGTELASSDDVLADSGPDNSAPDWVARADASIPSASVQAVTAEPQPPEDWANSAYRLLIAAPRGPLTVALMIEVNQLPLREAYEQQLTETLKRADADGDGVTKWSELWDFPQIRFGDFGNTPANNDQQRYDQQQRYDFNGDGVADSAELAMLAMGDRRRSGPLQLVALPKFEQFASLDGTILQWLDQNRDSRVDADEMLATDRRLVALDSNADGAVSAAELQSAIVRPQPAQRRSAAILAPEEETAAFLLSEQSRWEEILYALEMIYAQAGPLADDETSVVAHFVRGLDANADGFLVPAELAHLAQDAPDYLWIVRFDASDQGVVDRGAQMQAWRRVATENATENGAESAAENGAENAVTESGPSWQLLTESRNEGLVSSWQGTPLHFQSRDPLADASQDQYAQLLAQFDRDANEYLDMNELLPLLATSGLTPDQAGRFDPDENSMVTLEEIAGVLSERRRAGQVVVELSMELEGDRWSGMDTNGDGMLGEREWSVGREHLEQRDTNHDGQLAGDELTRQIRTVVTRGGTGAMLGPAVRPASAPSGAPLSDAPPRWFLAFDHNGDGEVSWREFLGTREQFERLDRSGDGYLEVAEVTSDSPDITP